MLSLSQDFQVGRLRDSPSKDIWRLHGNTESRSANFETKELFLIRIALVSRMNHSVVEVPSTADYLVLYYCSVHFSPPGSNMNQSVGPRARQLFLWRHEELREATVLVGLLVTRIIPFQAAESTKGSRMTICPGKGTSICLIGSKRHNQISAITSFASCFSQVHKGHLSFVVSRGRLVACFWNMAAPAQPIQSIPVMTIPSQRTMVHRRVHSRETSFCANTRNHVDLDYQGRIRRDKAFDLSQWIAFWADVDKPAADASSNRRARSLRFWVCSTVLNWIGPFLPSSLAGWFTKQAQGLRAGSGTLQGLRREHLALPDGEDPEDIQPSSSPPCPVFYARTLGYRRESMHA
jgi:hypothetical protein